MPPEPSIPPNVQVGPDPGGLNGTFFTYYTGDGLFRDVNTPENWIQLLDEFLNWNLFGTPRFPSVSADVDDLTGQIRIRDTLQTNFFVCHDEDTGGSGVRYRVYDLYSL